jgi:hypothetical protein
MRPSRLLLIGLAAFAGFACARQRTPENAGVEWTLRDERSSWSADSTDTTKNVWVALHYPEFTSAPTPAALDSLNRWAHERRFALLEGDTLEKTVDGLAARLIRDYQAFRAQTGTQAATPWYLDADVGVAWDSLGVVSMVSFTESYLGGAHGETERTWGVLDAASGQRLSIGALVEADALDSLTRLGEAAFRSVRRIAPGAPLDEAGFEFEGGVFRLPPNFGLSEQGFEFVWGACEVAPCLFGPTEFRIPWDQVRPLLDAQGPLGSMRATPS